MAAFISFPLILLAALVAIPVIVLFIEVIAAATLPQPDYSRDFDANFCPRVGVIVPAHNESSTIFATIQHIRMQLRPHDRLLVVADNCSDDTAMIAAGAGAEVIERHDSERIGKGYALHFGLRHLSEDPPDVVLIIDADCTLSDAAIGQLASICATSGRPVQARYTMTAPDQSPIDYRVAEFAWRVRNWVRPLGLRALGLPCQLMGTGMAFPWEVIRSADLATGWIVEDLKLGLDLALAGKAPLFWPSAVARSCFPLSAVGAETQRKRWEYGHLRALCQLGARLFFIGIAQRNPYLLALVLDLVVPPLSLLAILTIFMLPIAGLGALVGLSPAPFFLSVGTFLLLTLTVVISWVGYGRDVLPSQAILSTAFYVIRKLPLYHQILTSRVPHQWVRTDRSGQD
jgi:cellulose synthase/poly-beta-1,6-N-acetylglucosamine synthase-like glycosyltransferase